MEPCRSKTREYLHLGGSEVRSVAGGYSIEKEELLPFGGRRVLCEIGSGLVDSSCCGVGGCRFAHVAGFVSRYRIRQDEVGRWISEVQPIRDELIKQRVEQFLKEKHLVQQVLWEA